MTKFQGAMPATEACALSAAPLSHGSGAFALDAAPSASGARASGAAPLRYGINQAAGAWAWGVAYLSLDTGTHAPSTAPPTTPRAVVRRLRLHVDPFSERFLLLQLPAMRW